jgi:hypothetical protein
MKQSSMSLTSGAMKNEKHPVAARHAVPEATAGRRYNTISDRVDWEIKFGRGGTSGSALPEIVICKYVRKLRPELEINDTQYPAGEQANKIKMNIY